MRHSYLLLIILSFFSMQAAAQVWVVPDDLASRLSPAAFTDSSRKAGSELYLTNCKSCHGDPGKNNPVKLVPLPPDPASDQMQKNTDGSLLYKIVTGRGPMPAFRNNLSTNDLWRIISFIRSFNDKYVQEVAKKAASAIYQGVQLAITGTKDGGQVAVSLSVLQEGQRRFLPGAEIKLSAKRYFGNLPVGEPRTTDSRGIALFKVPADLPGDSLGLVHLIAKPVDEASFGESSAFATLPVGLVVNQPPLNQPRALWNVVQKTPIWLLVTYTLSVIAVWGFIVYVLLQVRAIFKSGSDELDT